MTHEQLTELLRDGRCDWKEDSEIADRLDRYRETLIEARRQMDEMAEVLWASPGKGNGWLGTGFIDEALK
jgi:hypothetical protein